MLCVALLASVASGQECCGSLSDVPVTQGISGVLAAAEPAPQETPSEQTRAELSLPEVRAVLDGLIETSYPELKGIRLVLYTFKDKTINFRSNFAISSLFFGKRKYKIGVNKKVLKDAPPPTALRAVLAHELAHTLYYHQRNRRQLIGTAKIFFNRSAQIDFELATDLVAVSRGFGPGLALYREWIQPRLPAKTAAKYAATYYDVSDFELLERVKNTHPGTLLTWLKDPPRTGEEILERMAAGL